MRYRLLWFIPLGFTLFYWLGFIIFGDLPWYNDYSQIEITLMKLLSALGYLAAALSFRKKEYLRRGWMFLALAMFVFFVNDIILRTSLSAAFSEMINVLWLGAIVSTGNFFMIAGIWTISSAWSRAGLDFSETGLKPWYITVLAVMLGFLVVGPQVISDIISILEGEITAIIALRIISGVGTTVALGLIARLLLTLLVLHETNLRWSWLFLCIVLVSWMLFDGIDWWGNTIGLPDQQLTCIREIFRILACTFAISAGLAQRFVQQEIRMNKNAPKQTT